MISATERADQVYRAFMSIVNDPELAKKLTFLSIENMSWAAHTKYEADYFSKMKKHIYEKSN
jgi:hypothetical protein